MSEDKKPAEDDKPVDVNETKTASTESPVSEKKNDEASCLFIVGGYIRGPGNEEGKKGIED